MRREGHCNVPENHLENGFKLGQWAGKQRQNKVGLPEDRLLRLEQLGFIWDVLTEQWETGFSNLVQFREREGHCRVSQTHLENNHKLGVWVGTQRTKKNELSLDRLRRLDELGFVWDTSIQFWEAGFASLVTFKAREGHCQPSQAHIEDDFKLGAWVSRQRQKKSELSEDRISRLNELGFVWSAKR